MMVEIRKFVPLSYVCARTQSCPTLCVPIDCSLPGFTVRGIFQARVLELVAISFLTRDRIQVFADSLPSELPLSYNGQKLAVLGQYGVSKC